MKSKRDICLRCSWYRESLGRNSVLDVRIADEGGLEYRLKLAYNKTNEWKKDLLCEVDCTYELEIELANQEGADDVLLC